MQRKTSPLNTDDSYQNTVDSSINYIEGPTTNLDIENKENGNLEIINSDEVRKNDSQRRLSSSSRLNDQERKTRIAFLQNRQAELETEIQLLKQSQEFEKLITDEPLISDSLLKRNN